MGREKKWEGGEVSRVGNWLGECSGKVGRGLKRESWQKRKVRYIGRGVKWKSGQGNEVGNWAGE